MPEGESDGKDDGNGASYISYGITRSAIRLVADREERPHLMLCVGKFRIFQQYESKKYYEIIG